MANTTNLPSLSRIMAVNQPPALPTNTQPPNTAQSNSASNRTINLPSVSRVMAVNQPQQVQQIRATEPVMDASGSLVEASSGTSPTMGAVAPARNFQSQVLPTMERTESGADVPLSESGKYTWQDFGKDFMYGTERAGAALLGFGEGFTDFVGSNFYGALSGITSAGGLAPNKVSDWMARNARMYLDNSISQDYLKNIEERYKPTEGQKLVADIGSAVTDNLAAIATGQAATKYMNYLAGAGKALSADKIAHTAQTVAKGIMSLSAAGRNASEAASEGASTERALAHGTAVGSMELLLEGLGGGVPTLGKGKLTQVVEKLIKNPKVAALISIVGEATNEGFEEAASTFLTPYIKIALYDKDAALATPEEISQSVLMGMISSGVLQVGLDLPSAFARNNSKTNTTTKPGTVTTKPGTVTTKPGNVTTELGNVTTELGNVTTELGNVTTEPGNVTTEPEMRTTDTSTDADTAATDVGVEVETHMRELAPKALPEKVELTKEWSDAFYQARQAGDRLGVKVELAQDLPDGVAGEYRNGVIRISERAKDPLKSTFVHELTHHLEATGSYGELREYVLSRAVNSVTKDGITLEAYRKRIQDAYAAKGKTIDDAGVDKEIVAKYVELNLFNNSKEIARLAKTHRNLVQVIRDWFTDLRVRFRGTAEEKELLRAQRLFEKALRETDVKGYRTSGDGQWAVGNTQNYDYSKPFSEQIEDFKAGRIPKNDTLLVSGTPKVFQDIGLSSLPMTINQTHVDYAVNGTKDFDHYLTEEGLRQLPEALEHPIAIMASKTKPKSSVVAMLEVRQNGKQVVVPVLVEGFGYQNGIRIDSNALTSVYGKDYSISKVLYNAIQDELSGTPSLYYLNKNSSEKLFQRARVLMPKMSGVSLDGTIHRITDANSPVKPKFTDVTQTQQFSRWFGDSKVVDKNGLPLVMYHGTRTENGDFYEFDSSKAVKKGGLGFRAMGKGNYFTSKKLNGTERYGSRVIPAYLSIKQPFVYKSGSSFSEQVGQALGIADAAKMSHDELQNALRQAGYDGVIQYDGDGNVLIAVTFDSNQIKSATENIGTFDPNNPDIRYSIDFEGQELLRASSGRTAEEVRADTKAAVEQYSAMDPHKQPGVRDAEYPYETAQGRTMRTPQNIGGSNLVDDRIELDIEEAIFAGKFAYEVRGDKASMREANQRIEGGSYEALAEQAKGLFADGYRLKKEQVVFVERMIQEASKRADVDTAMSLIADLAAYGTEQGQNIQALSLIRRMTPEGKLMVLKRQVDKANKITQIDRESKGEIKQTEREIKEIKREAFSGLEDIGVDESMDIETAQRIVDEAIADETAKSGVSGLPTEKKARLQRKKQELSEAEKKANELEKAAKNLKNPVVIPKATVKAMLESNSPTEQNDLYNKALDEIASQIVSSLPDKANAWRYLAMLGNPRTHIRNLTGNSTMYMTNAAKNIVKRVIELVPGTQKTTVLKASKEAKAFAKEDFELNRDLITGGGKMNASDELRDRMTIFKNKGLEALRKFNTNAMEAEDTFFIRHAYESALARYITANKKSKSFLEGGSSAAESFLQKAREYAIKEAREVTFHDDSALADWLSGITRSAKDDKLGVKTAKVMVEGVLPFKKTPINVAKRGIEYSPVSLATAIGKFAKGDAAGGVDDLAKGATGSIMMGIGLALAHLGMLRTKNEEKDEVLDTQENEQNYSLRIPNEDGTVTSVSLDALMPAAMPLLVGVEVNRLLKEEDMSIMSVLKSLTGIADPIVENSMLDGLNDMLSYVGYSDNALGQIATDMGESYVEQFRPSILRQLAQSIDPTVRTTYAPKDSPIGKGFETHLRSLGNALPWGAAASEKIDEAAGTDRFALQPKIDVWGNEVKRADSFGARLVQNMVLPFNVKKVTSDPVNEELRRLYGEDSTFAVLPKAANKNYEYHNETYYAEPAEYTALAKNKGQQSYEYLENAMGTSEYKALPDAKKADVIANLYQYAHYKAKQDFFDGRGINYVSDTFNGVEKAVKRGITAEDYYIMKAQMDGGETAEEKIPYYMDMLTKEQKAFVNSLPKDAVDASWVERIALSNQGENAKTTSAYDDILIGEKKEKIDYSDKASIYLSLIDGNANSKIGDKYYEYAKPAGVSVEDYMIAYFAQKNVTYPPKTKGAKAAAEAAAIDKAVPHLSQTARNALYDAFK